MPAARERARSATARALHRWAPMPRAWPTKEQLEVETLGPCAHPSPLGLGRRSVPSGHFTPEGVRVLALAEIGVDAGAPTGLSFEKAGPRERIYFDPPRTRAAIVTCGGLCPGINDVIRSAVLELVHRYGAREVIGFRYGFAGMAKGAQPPIRLTVDEVRHIHKQGGTLLGTSRGQQDIGDMADTLQRLDVQILLTVGGDGTQRGARAIVEELGRRNAKIAVVGVPKTIDDDLLWTDRTFGFETAVATAKVVIEAAHTEALAADRGIGLVKLMGRDSGFIAATATLASLETNFCLVPEVHVDLEGPGGLFDVLERRLTERRHAVIVVAEGCVGLFDHAEGRRDESGNVRYSTGSLDVGARLRDAIEAHFTRTGRKVTLKYIDPSYVIRSVTANASDAIFCDGLARNAVHAAMAGKTSAVVGRWYGLPTLVPIAAATAGRKTIDPEGSLWLAVTETTGQPPMVRRA